MSDPRQTDFCSNHLYAHPWPMKTARTAELPQGCLRGCITPGIPCPAEIQSVSRATEAQILSCAWFSSSVAASTAESLMGKAFRLNNESSTFSAMNLLVSQLCLRRAIKQFRFLCVYRYLEKCYIS